MTRPDEPSQSEVLRERFARVPWRLAVREAIRDRRGSGRTALPDRLEGAVYGQLVGDALGWSGSSGSPDAPPVAWSGESARMLSLLDSLLSGTPDREAGTSAVVPSLGGVLPVPLVMRAREPREIADLAAKSSGLRGEALAACALHALVVRRLVAGERGPADVLARAIRDLRATPLAPPGRSTGDPVVDGFWSGWDAFEGSDCYRDAVTRALGTGPGAGESASIAGGLAGAYWGSTGVPPAWQRGLPEPLVARSLVDRLIETDIPGWDGRPWQTSTSSPLRVDFLELAGREDRASGAIGITSLPGRRYVGYHTGAHWRDLEADAARLRDLGVGALLLLVEDHELVRCRVTGIGEALAAADVELVRFPIRDPLLPRDGVAFRGTIASLLRRVRDGKTVAIACRGGLDRAGMTGACLLREAGFGTEEAIQRVQSARRGALTLPDQQAYVRGWPPHR